jgi:transcriptional regulator with XRE-family HTH domain
MNKYSLSSEYPLNPKTVKKLLIDLEMTQLELIDKIDGLAASTILRYINGQGRNPKIQQAIADALGVELDEILDKQSTDLTPALSTEEAAA